MSDIRRVVNAAGLATPTLWNVLRAVHFALRFIPKSRITVAG